MSVTVMPTRNQHYVPRVYLKAWETSVETLKEPNKKFQGMYTFYDGNVLGDGRTKESVLWEPHLYTIKFNQSLYIAEKCPAILAYYVDAIYDAMINNEPASVYGKIGYSIIKTKPSIKKHLKDISAWDFYYEDGNVAKKKSILNRINDIRCYILEDSFSNLYESQWENVRDSFIKAVKNGYPVAYGTSERYIAEKAATDMLRFFFMMLCRNPNFKAMGIYTWLNNILCSTFGNVSEIDDMMNALWFSELYRMFYKNTCGFYHSVLSMAFDKCQLILFEAYNGSEMFITSDSPAYQNNCNVLVNNENGYILPLTPKYMLFIAKGSGSITVADHRFANEDTVRHFNQITKNSSHHIIIGVKKHLSEML